MYKINILGSCVSKISLLNGNKTEKGIYGEDIQQGYFLDKQNIAFATMPAPFTNEEIDAITADVLYDKTRLNSLKQCLNKSTIDLLLASDAQYLVMDLYDFQNDFLIYNNTAFSTCAHEFLNTELFKRNCHEMKLGNLMQLPPQTYYPAVDRFFQRIMQKYDAEHIILIRFRSNKYYWAKDGQIRLIPGSFKQPYHSNDNYNEPLRKLEEYIISKYNPYVIDLSRFYMGNENEWDNLNGAHFEHRFYHRVYSFIYEIITGKATTKYYEQPEFIWDSFGVSTPEEQSWKFDVECALALLPQLIEADDILWINLLHKLNIYAPEDARVARYNAMLDSKRLISGCIPKILPEPHC